MVPCIILNVPSRIPYDFVYYLIVMDWAAESSNESRLKFSAIKITQSS